MIQVNERFSISRDAYGWQLHERYMGADKETGAPKQMTRTTYPGRLWVALSRIVEACGDEAKDIAELRDTILKTVDDFKSAVDRA